MVSLQTRDRGPKVQRFVGKSILMREWNEAGSGTNPCSELSGISDNLNGRAVGPR
jgi:hypothetical protein